MKYIPAELFHYRPMMVRLSIPSQIHESYLIVSQISTISSDMQWILHICVFFRGVFFF